MEWALFSYSGVHYCLKWLHFFFGILWIGHLYYLDFNLNTFLSSGDEPGESQALKRLIPGAFSWFRWGSFGTLLTGLLMFHTASYIGFRVESDWGVKIMTGALFGIFMFFNVWFVIWPKQKMILESAEDISENQVKKVELKVSNERLALVLRTNSLFSIPLLFYMGAASHLPVQIDMTKAGLWYAVIITIAGALQINAMKGKLGPLKTVKGVIISGFVLTALIYVLMEFLL